MSSFIHICLISFSLLILAACGPTQEETSHPHFMTGAALARGHEDITRIGVDKANDALQGLVGYRPYPSIAKGVAGIDSGNQMIKGNYETDFPDQRMCAFHNENYEKCSSNSYWHNSGHLQYLHTLRNFVDSTPVTMRQACEASRDLIRRATIAALAAFQAGQVEDGRYWLGHATHTIQDSFSKAHATRAGSFEILDICVYGKDIPGVCKHDSPASDDYIWKNTLSCRLNPNNRDENCMKPEARDAVNATANYLARAGEAIFNNASLDQSLQSFFGNPAAGVEGYFACEKY